MSHKEHTFLLTREIIKLQDTCPQCKALLTRLAENEREAGDENLDD